MKLKPALTYEQQIKKLKVDHNLTITDDDHAKYILKKVHDYTLSGYEIGLKKINNKEHYKDGITIEHIFQLYCFDSEFKHKLIRTLEQIEIELKSQISYFLDLQYGPAVLMNEGHFIHRENNSGKTIYPIVLESLNKESSRQKNRLFVRHHIENYNGQFPIWVSVELMSFGVVSS